MARTIKEIEKRKEWHILNENSMVLDNSITPTVEEWEEICNPEPELSILREKIRKQGFINEEY